MSLTGDEEHAISLEEAIEYTAKYRDSRNSGDLLGGYFGKSAMQNILNQPNCVGLRIYNAIDNEGKATYVVVGVAADEKDLTEGAIAEYAYGCPPHCPLGSPLAGTE